MKKIVFILFGFSLLILSSFVNKSNTDKISADVLIGNWAYESVMHNGKLSLPNSCDEMDFLKLNPNGNFEALQHVNVISASTGIGTVTNCSPIKTNGNWSITSNGKLIRNNTPVEIFEITETTLKLRSVVTRMNNKGETIKDIYIDSYTRQ